MFGILDAYRFYSNHSYSKLNLPGRLNHFWTEDKLFAMTVQSHDHVLDRGGTIFHMALIGKSSL